MSPRLAILDMGHSGLSDSEGLCYAGLELTVGKHGSDFPHVVVGEFGRGVGFSVLLPSDEPYFIHESDGGVRPRLLCEYKAHVGLAYSDTLRYLGGGESFSVSQAEDVSGDSGRNLGADVLLSSLVSGVAGAVGVAESSEFSGFVKESACCQSPCFSTKHGAHARRRDSKSVGDSLDGEPARVPESEYLPCLFGSEFAAGNANSMSVPLFGNTIIDVVLDGAELEVSRVDAAFVVAEVHDNLARIQKTVDQKERQTVGADLMLGHGEHSVTGGVEPHSPFVAIVVGDINRCPEELGEEFPSVLSDNVVFCGLNHLAIEPLMNPKTKDKI